MDQQRHGRRHRDRAAARPVRRRHDQGRHRRGRSRCSRPTAPTAPSATPTPLADFPALVAAAPKGLFLVGPPALELDGDTGTGEQPLCFVDQTNHDMRIGWYTDTYRRTDDGLAAAHPVDDVPAHERRPRLRASRTTRRRPAPTAVADGARRVPRRRSTAGSTSTPTSWRRRTTGDRHARRADGPPVEGQAARLRRRLDAVGLARARSAASAARTLLRGLPRRGAHGPRPRRARHLLDDRGAGADDDRLRPARRWRPRWCRGCCGATRRGARASPSRAPAATSASLACRATRTDDGWRGQRPEGVDEPRPVRAALRAAHPHRHRRVGPPRASPRCSSTWTRPGITVRPIEAMHGRRGVLRGLLRRRRSCRSSARSARRARAGPWPWTCCPTSAAPRCGTAARYLHRRLERAARRRAPTARSTPSRGRRGVPAAVRLPGPVAGHPAPAGSGRDARPRDVDRQDPAGHRRAGGVRPRRRRPRRRRSCSATTPTSERWRSEYLYSRAATIYGGSAEIQRNIVARRLLDLGADR